MSFVYFCLRVQGACGVAAGLGIVYDRRRASLGKNIKSFEALSKAN